MHLTVLQAVAKVPACHLVIVSANLQSLRGQLPSWCHRGPALLSLGTIL